MPLPARQRKLLAQDPHTPEETLVSLLTDGVETVRKAARRNSSVPWTNILEIELNGHIHLCLDAATPVTDDVGRATRALTWREQVRVGRKKGRGLLELCGGFHWYIPPDFDLQQSFASADSSTTVWAAWAASLIDDRELSDAAVLRLLRAAAITEHPLDHLASFGEWQVYSRSPSCAALAELIHTYIPPPPAWVLEAPHRRSIWTAVATHPLAPLELLVALTQSEDSQVLAAVARHPHADPTTVIPLLDHPDPDVRASARGSSVLPELETERLVSALEQRAAQQQQLENEEVDCLVDTALGAKLWLTVHRLRNDATDARSHRRHRWHVAITTNDYRPLDLSQLQALIALGLPGEPLRWVDWALEVIATDQVTDAEALRVLCAADAASPVYVLNSQVEWQWLARCPRWDLLAGVTEHHDVPADVLTVYADGPRHDQRVIVAGHPATPPEVRHRLAQDPYPPVRSAAARGSDHFSGLPTS